MALTLSMLVALFVDALCGEPRRGHPLAGFGAIADALERRYNHDGWWAGALAAVALSLGPALAIGGLVHALPWPWGWVIAMVVASLCIGRRSLGEHVQAVAAPLTNGDLVQARQRVAWLVSRDTAAMDAAAVRRATIESLLENASDAVFASLFWFAVGGLLLGPGGAAALVLWQRLANTLDAMWGYRSARFRRFGYAAARLDDALNWLPARATALVFAVAGHGRGALYCWRRQAGHCPSPNGGVVMTAGAGALHLWLGGGAYYRGQWEQRPWMGCGAVPGEGAIRRALVLVRWAVVLFCLVIVCVDGLIV